LQLQLTQLLLNLKITNQVFFKLLELLQAVNQIQAIGLQLLALVLTQMLKRNIGD
jgi:hypothetical protein